MSSALLRRSTVRRATVPGCCRPQQTFAPQRNPVLVHPSAVVMQTRWFARHAEFALRLKTVSLNPWYVWIILAVTLLFEVLPYLEELLRGLRRQPPAASDQQAAAHPNAARKP